jgi:glycosyltransferase involved in cell wall biosynthesis
MKHILIDMHRLKHNPYNGLYIYSKDLGNHLSVLKEPGIELHFYLAANNFGFFGDNVKYEKHHSIDKYFLFGTRQFDVWHVTTTLSWYRPFHKRVKIVYTIHDLHFLIEHKDDVKRNERILYHIRKRAARADHIIAISNYSLNVANELLPIKDKPQSVIYNGCSFQEYPLFDNPRYRPQKPFLFSIGQFYARKNFHVLPPLLKNNDYELVIAGLNDLPYAKQVQEVAREYGVQDRVKLIGPITEEEKDWYYKKCKAFMFPSYAEGFGLPVIEAMQYGKPVFLSTSTCLPEIGGDVAYYFDNFDPDYMQKKFVTGMQHYNQDNPQDKIKSRAAQFTWQKAAQQYMDVYKSLL